MTPSNSWSTESPLFEYGDGMSLRLSSLLALILLLGGRGLAATCSSPQDPAALGIDLSQQSRCDPLVPERCLLPFPSDYFTVADAGTRSGRRVQFLPESLPVNVGGTPLEASELNRSDGFSPGAALLAWMPTADLVLSGAPALTDIGRSLEADSPIVIVDARTGRLWPAWAELDMNSPADNRALIIRPAVDFQEGHRYVVAVRRIVDATGTPLAPSPAFAAYRNGTCTTDATFESRRDHMESLFQSLDRAGIGRGDLQLAWDFTIASAQSTAGRLLHARDDAFRWLSNRVPNFTVTSTEEQPNPQVWRRVHGTFEVPLYLTGNGGPGERYALDASGLPVRQPVPYVATFTCDIPPAATTKPARMSLYGHGLLGDQSEVNGSLVRTMSATYDVVYCAADWIGMAEEDFPNAIAILQDLSRFATLADRLQQGFLDFLFLGRLMRHPGGFASHPAFRSNGVPVIDTNELYFDGNSQGAIVGGALCAVARDFRRCVLAEAGMNYSTLLQRSVDFDLYKLVLDTSYPDPFVQLLALNVVQMLWDRGETNGYAQHLTRSAYPHTPRHKVLLLGAVGDHQVSEFSLQVEARTIGARGHVPYVAPDREYGGEHGFGITPITRYPWSGSAYFLWDTGSPLSPLDNTPPRAGHDPHDDTPKIPAVQALKDAFWHRKGTAIDVCAGAPCTGPQF
jgi:hypothetical protein